MLLRLGHLKKSQRHGERAVGYLLAVEGLEEYHALVDRQALKIPGIDEAHAVLLIHILFDVDLSQFYSPDLLINFNFPH